MPHGRNENIDIDNIMSRKQVRIAEEVEEDNLGAELFQKFSINSSHSINTNECVSSDDDFEGDDEEISRALLSISTSKRSLLPFEMDLPVKPLLPTDPAPLEDKYWCEPCASSFRVRGPKYTKYKKKIASGSSLFRLVAVDVLETDKAIMTGMCAHPDERVQKCLRAEKEGRKGSEMPPFIFCINITVPGKPFFHLVFYYAVDDMSLIQPGEGGKGDSFNNVASKFFFGSSDKFRNSTFKLIPRIVYGSYVIKKAVGSKPALLGKKVKTSYIMNERYFEIIVDVGSDKVAKTIVGLSRGCAESLIVDMGFVLEGKDLKSLPEQLMGAVRLEHINFKDKRFVRDPSKSSA
jgi:hypothetical protein